MSKLLLIGISLLHMCCISFASQDKVTRDTVGNVLRALKHHCSERLQKMIESFVANQKEDIDFRDKDNQTPLHEAVYGPLRYVQLFVENGADINAIDKDENTPLMLTVWDKNKIEMIKFLLEHGADPNIKNKKGVSALSEGAFRNNIGVVKLLLMWNAQVNDKSLYGHTALIEAVRNRNCELVKTLLDHEANVFIADDDSKIPLMYAVMCSKRDATSYGGDMAGTTMVKMLLKHISVSKKDRMLVRKRIAELSHLYKYDSSYASLPAELLQHISRVMLHPFIKKQENVSKLLAMKDNEGKMAIDYAGYNEEVHGMLDTYKNISSSQKAIGRWVLGDTPPDHIIPLLPHELQYESASEDLVDIEL